MIGLYCACLALAILIRTPVSKALAVMSDQNLNGTYIVIDAGHGGNDPGAKVNGQDEDEINLDLALKLAEILRQAGAVVELTRNDDYDLADSDADNIKRSDMQHRAEVMNQDAVTLFVSIHCNTSGDQRCSGSQVYYRTNDAVSKKLADTIQASLKEITDSRYIPCSGDFYLLNNTQTLGALIEVGFLTNAQDLSRLQKESYREEIAYGIYEGISEFLSILY